jgi:hypothetical protein
MAADTCCSVSRSCTVATMGVTSCCHLASCDALTGIRGQLKRRLIHGGRRVYYQRQAWEQGMAPEPRRLTSGPNPWAIALSLMRMPLGADQRKVELRTQACIAPAPYPIRPCIGSLARQHYSSVLPQAGSRLVRQALKSSTLNNGTGRNGVRRWRSEQDAQDIHSHLAH